MWHFADGSCYPQAAEVDGVQTNGNEPGGDLCVIDNLATGCQNPGPWLGPNTEGTSFPTYYTLGYCSGDNTWRIAYDIYFRHDSGHESDWEYVIVVFTQDSGSLWYRDYVIFEQDGNTPTETWGTMDTFNDPNNAPDGVKNENHAKIYVTKWHHAMWYNNYTNFKDDCLVSEADQFRVNDFYQYSGDSLVNGSVIPVSWHWGSATSAPMTMAVGASQDICGK